MSSKQRILDYLKSHETASGRELRELLAISRQALGVHLRELIRSGELVKSGSTRGARYHIPGHLPARATLSRRLTLAGLDESGVFEDFATLMNLKTELRSNIQALLRYAFTEMLNNAIDHSRAETSEVRFKTDAAKVVFQVRDHGIGVFHSIATKFSLPDESAALLELLKGKTTTAPRQHSGEGIFFTTRAADRFLLRSHRIQLEWDNRRNDVFVSQLRYIQGTDVQFEIERSSRRRLEKTFAEFAPEEYGFQFQKTRILVRLLRSDYVSRSEAKRLLVNLERFREVRLDFRKVQSVGQGFADEVFRVFAERHPEIKIIAEKASKPVMAMLRHAGHPG